MMYTDVRWLPLAPAAAVRSIRTARLAAGPWGTLARGQQRAIGPLGGHQPLSYRAGAAAWACGACGWAAGAGRGLSVVCCMRIRPTAGSTR